MKRSVYMKDGNNPILFVGEGDTWAEVNRLRRKAIASQRNGRGRDNTLVYEGKALVRPRHP